MNWADFHFIRPYWLLLLFPAAGLIIWSLRQKLAQGNWASVCDDALLPFILQQTESKPHRWLHAVLSLASLLAIIALAGPAWERLPTPAFRNDSSLVIALDLSRSMDATDVKPSRLTRAHYKVADILNKRKDGLTALVAYAGSAYTVTPLTQDTATISNQLNALTTNIMPSQGGNTAAAIKQAVALLQQAGKMQGDILLVTDGIHSDIIKQAASLLGNYRLSVLGIGTTAGAPIQLADGGFLKDNQGNIVIPQLKPTQLATLARTGDGIYRSLSTDDRDTNALLALFDGQHSQESGQTSQQLIEKWDEKGPWLLLLLLPLMALYFRKGLLVVPVILLLNIPQPSYAFGWDDLWQTPDQQAQHAFLEDDFAQAATQFQSAEWQAAAEYKAGNYAESAATLADLTSPSAHYNRGNALAKAGELQQAADAYTQALEMDANHQDALFNKDLVEKALAQQQENQDQNQEQGDKQEQSEGEDSKDSESEGSESDQNQAEQEQSEQSDAEDAQKSESESGSSPPQDSKQQENDDPSAEQAEPESEQTEAEEQEEAQSESEGEASDQEPTPAAPSESQETDETDRATEQWLQRIPDDPAGLLKRKFKYQYQRQPQRRQQAQQW